MNHLGNFAVSPDHVLPNTGRAQPDHARHCIAVLQPAVAAPPEMDAAFEHDSDFGFARQEFGEVAFGVAPAFGQQAVPSPVDAAPEQRSRGVLRSSVPGQTAHAAILP